MSASINICFSTTEHLTSRLIRWVTGSRVSHALITYRDATLGKIMVLEATAKGFWPQPWARWKEQNTLVARFALTLPEDVQLRALRQLAELIGEGYDYGGAAGWVARLFRRVENPLDSKQRLFCSEAVALFLSYTQILPQKADPALQSPEDLLKICTYSRNLVCAEGQHSPGELALVVKNQ